MIRRGLGLRALGLCAMAFGLATFAGAASVQAEAGATWTITNSKTGELQKIPGATDLLPLLQVKEIENKTASLLLPVFPITILCTTAKFDEGGKLMANGTVSSSRMLFTGCITTLKGEFISACQARSPGLAKGELLTEKFSSLIVLDELPDKKIDSFVKVAPVEGPSLLIWEYGETCALGKMSVAGEVWLKDCQNAFTVEQVDHLVEEALRRLTFAGQTATIDGSAIVSLAQEHIASKWAGLPG